MPSFLTPLLAPAGRRLVLRNERTGAIVADRLLAALDSRSRRTGLLKHTGLSPGEAMIIAPTNAIHTFFMRFRIDVAFVDRKGRIVKIFAAMRPWRIAGAWSGHAVIEMAAYTLAQRSVVGDTLSITLAEDRRV